MQEHEKARVAINFVRCLVRSYFAVYHLPTYFIVKYAINTKQFFYSSAEVLLRSLSYIARTAGFDSQKKQLQAKIEQVLKAYPQAVVPQEKANDSVVVMVVQYFKFVVDGVSKVQGKYLMLCQSKRKPALVVLAAVAKWAEYDKSAISLVQRGTVVKPTTLLGQLPKQQDGFVLIEAVRSQAFG